MGRDGEETPVVDLCATGVFETVYNFRVADCHTYIVGKPDWGFTIWAHNACTGSYGQLRSSNNRPAGAQVNHLNQHAAFGSGHVTGGIRYRAGAAIYLQGGTNVVGSEHYVFHQELRAFWRRHRLNDTIPNNHQYATAVGRALRAAQVPEADVRRALIAARAQRLAHGFADSDPVPRVPAN